MSDNDKQSGGDTVCLLRVVRTGWMAMLARSTEMRHLVGVEGILSIASQNLFVIEQPVEL